MDRSTFTYNGDHQRDHTPLKFKTFASTEYHRSQPPPQIPVQRTAPAVGVPAAAPLEPASTVMATAPVEKVEKVGSVKPTKKEDAPPRVMGPKGSSAVVGLDELLGTAPENVLQAATEWCIVNQVVDVDILFEDPDEVDMVLASFLDALPLNAGGIYDKRLRKRLSERRSKIAQ